MKLNLKDKSCYLKGLLVLIGKDKKISKNESDFIMNVGKRLGFDKSFCEEAINTLLENEYITDDPPVFSDQNFAKSFIEDAISIAITDNDFCLDEEDYLKSIAKENAIEESWLEEQLFQAKRIYKNISLSNPHLAVEKHL